MAFGEPTELDHLIVTGLGDKVTGLGLANIVNQSHETLRIYEAALMRQEALKAPEYGKAMAQCGNLESIDISGCREMTDDFFMQMCTAPTRNPDGSQGKPNFPYLHTGVFNFLVNVNGSSFNKLL